MTVTFSQVQRKQFRTPLPLLSQQSYATRKKAISRRHISLLKERLLAAERNMHGFIGEEVRKM